MVYRQTVNTISSASLHPAQRALGSRAVRSRRFALPLKRLGILPCSPFLRGAVSAAGSAPLRHVASQVLRTIWRKLECVLICQNLTNRNAHAMHGRFCLLDPGGYLLSRVHSSQSSRCCAYACIARCSLGLRLASSPTGRARLRPLQVKRFTYLNEKVSQFPRYPAQERERTSSS